ncbi:MAG TPA: Fis family transcriptional regulator [Cyanobacteria bacterium UBA8803]|nr:Fis family transcriptional regulator [Cyanobacteria bacterium UBA9273]HBL59098.1 Fis family transcriptional regulator [Cyanobacteria bacterium UBA8803]
MRLPRIGLTLLALLSVTIETPRSLNLTTLLGVPQVLAQTPANRKAEADLLLKQGIEQLYDEDTDAVDSFEQALAIYREIKNRQGEGQTLAYLGEHYRGYSTSLVIEYSEQALAIAREIHDHQLEGKALNNLGWGYYEQASDGYDISDVGSYDSEGIASNGSVSNYTRFYDALGDYAKAIEYFQQSLAIARKVNSSELEANTLNALTQTYLSLNNYDKGLDYFNQLLRLAKELNDASVTRQARPVSVLITNYLYQKTYAKQILESFEQLLPMVRELKDQRWELEILHMLGKASHDAGNYSKAIEYTQQLLPFYQGSSDRKNKAILLDNLAGGYTQLGDYAKAIEYSQQSLALARELKDYSTEVQALYTLSEIYFKKGDYNQGIENAQQLLALARELTNREAMTGSAQFLGVRFRTYEELALRYLGMALYETGKFADAERVLVEGVQVAESRRNKRSDQEKVSLVEEQAGLYILLQKVLIAQNKTDAALEVAEQGRARAVVDLLASPRREQSTQPSLPQRLPVTESPTIEQIKQIAKAQNSTLVEYSIVPNKLRVQGEQPQTLELYIWVVKPTDEIVFRRVDLKPQGQQQSASTEDLVTNIRQSIGVSDRASIAVVQAPKADQKQSLQKLYQLLIEPIADLLPSDEKARVIFIPKSALFLIPFSALQDEQGKYLIEKHTILTAPSIQVLELTRQQRERLKDTTSGVSSDEYLVVGNPIMPSFPPALGQAPAPLQPLPGAEKEAQAIATLLKTQALIGQAATKTAVVQKMPTARIIHFATHGLIDGFSGFSGAIALAPSGRGRDFTSEEESDYRLGGGLEGQLTDLTHFLNNTPTEFDLVAAQNNNGFLTAADILKLKLNAELVVLSACNTGSGRIGEDGIIGLSRSFIAVGVPSVVVSLWSVPDVSTAQLMTEFYRQMQQNPDKAQALRQAMLSIKQQYPDPKDWAAFTLIGEAE